MRTGRTTGVGMRTRDDSANRELRGWFRWRRVVLAVLVVGLACWGRGAWDRHRRAVARASATARVGDDVSVCGLLPARVVEEVTGQQINAFDMYTLDDFRCSIYFGSPYPLKRIEVNYSSQFASAASLSVTKFESLAADSHSSPLSIERLEGRGNTYRNDRLGYLDLVWEYPDGHFASIRTGLMDSATDAERDAAMSALQDLFPRIAPTLPDTVSTLPRVLSASYPEPP